MKKILQSVRKFGMIPLESLFACIVCIGFFIFIAIRVYENFFSEIDERMMNLFVLIRNGAAAHVMLFFHYLGDWRIVIFLSFILMLAIWNAYSPDRGAFFFGAILAGGALSEYCESLVHRSMPDSIYALLSRSAPLFFMSDFSFPDTSVMLGTTFFFSVAYFFLIHERRVWKKIFFTSAVFLFIFFIGFSELYLGLHWFSDVLGGWVLGVAAASALIFIDAKFLRNASRYTLLSKKTRKAIALLIGVACVGIFFFIESHPLRVDSESGSGVIVGSVDSGDITTIFLSSSFPKFSRSMIGKRMEPVSIIFVGTREQVVQAFLHAGWHIANPLSTRSLAHAAYAALFNKPYPNAPVTPSFIQNQPEAFAFEKPTTQNSIRQRHHVRLWATSFTDNGVPIFVATASFDVGLNHIIIHKIAPNIDAERDGVRNNFESSGQLQKYQTLNLQPPYSGKNQNGDPFFTDGKSYVLYLKSVN